MPAPSLPLSVLDLAPLPEGVAPGAALARSVELARLADELGYRRYWVAEHHNIAGVASSSPAVLVAHLAAHTGRIRVGSGGVMLPNHPPLVIAEQFGLLATLHPGRIDLGLGRAPGSDMATARALRAGAGRSGDDFPEMLGELLGFLYDSFPEGHPYRSIRAVPHAEVPPSVWLLGSSTYSARAAGLLGLPFSFAHHFSPLHALPAVDTYRSSFRPSAVLDAPHVALGVAVLAADDDERAQWLHGPTRLSMLRLRTGQPGLLASPEAAEAHPWTEAERTAAHDFTASHIVGGPDTVRAGLRRLVEATGADELIVTTSTHAQSDRLHSYRLTTELAPATASVS